MLLSAEWKAFRALSRMARTSRNLIPCADSSSARMWAGRQSSPVIEPGFLRPRPNTSMSGEKPRRSPHEFLAIVHCVKACWSCWYVWISWSSLNLLNISCRTPPCRSIRPFASVRPEELHGIWCSFVLRTWKIPQIQILGLSPWESHLGLQKNSTIP